MLFFKENLLLLIDVIFFKIRDQIQYNNNLFSSIIRFSITFLFHTVKQVLIAKSSYRQILGVAVPMSLAIMIPQLSILANSIFLGNYQSSDGLVFGKEALSVAGIAGIYYLVYAMVCFGLASGLLMLMSRKAGNNEAIGVGSVFSAGVQIGLALTIVLIGVSFLFSSIFFDYSIQNEVVRQLSKEFMVIRIFGLPFLFLAHLGNMLFIAVNKTSYMLWGTIGQTLVNIALDYFLIFGHGPFSELGIEGAAIASVVAEIIFFLVVFCIIYYAHYFKAFKIRIFQKFQWDELVGYLSKSSPLMLQYLISIGGWEVFFIFIEHLGERELGASQIIRSAYGIIGILVWALSNTTNSLVSNLYGQKKYDEIVPITKKICLLSISYTLIVVVILFFFHLDFLGLYTQDEQIIALATPAFFVVLLASILFSFSIIYFNTLLGLGDTKRSLVYEAITISIYILFCYLVIEKQKPALWVAWTSEFVYWGCMLLFSGIYIHSKKWQPKSKL